MTKTQNITTLTRADHWSKPYLVCETPQAEVVCANFADRGIGFDFHIIVPMGEQDAVAALFPKMTKVRPSTVSTATGTHGLVTTRIHLRSDITTGAANETGMKRIKRILATCEEHGIRIVEPNAISNQLALAEVVR